MSNLNSSSCDPRPALRSLEESLERAEKNLERLEFDVDQKLDKAQEETKEEGEGDKWRSEMS